MIQDDFEQLYQEFTESMILAEKTQEKRSQLICECHCVTDKDIQEFAHRSEPSFTELVDHLGCGSGCGKCKELSYQTYIKFSKDRS